MKKIIIIVSSLLLVCVIGFLIYKNSNIQKQIEEIKVELEERQSEQEERKAEIETNRLRDDDENKRWSYRFYVVEEMMKKEVDWDKLILPDDIKKEYKKKYPYGLIPNENYDSIEIQFLYNNKEYAYIYNDSIIEFIATKGKKQDRYKVFCDESVRYCKIERIVKEELFDKNGEKIWRGYPMDEEHWIANMNSICITDGRDEVARSERFDIEHPNFTGLLNPYNERHRYLDIKHIDDQCDFDNKIYVCQLFYEDRKLYVTYKITYTVDEFNYLDTVSVEELSSREFLFNDKYKLFDSDDIFNKLLFKNRDREGLPFTKRYYDKIANMENIINNYDIYRIRSVSYDFGKKYNKMLLLLFLTNGEKKYVGLKYEIVYNLIDDIIVTELPLTEEHIKDYSDEELFDMF